MQDKEADPRLCIESKYEKMIQPRVTPKLCLLVSLGRGRRRTPLPAPKGDFLHGALSCRRPLIRGNVATPIRVRMTARLLPVASNLRPLSSKPRVSQPECVRDDRHRAQTHGGAGDHWAEKQAEGRVEKPGGDRDPDHVVNER